VRPPRWKHDQSSLPGFDIVAEIAWFRAKAVDPQLAAGKCHRLAVKIENRADQAIALCRLIRAIGVAMNDKECTIVLRDQFELDGAGIEPGNPQRADPFADARQKAPPHRIGKWAEVAQAQRLPCPLLDSTIDACHGKSIAIGQGPFEQSLPFLDGQEVCDHQMGRDHRFQASAPDCSRRPLSIKKRRAKASDRTLDCRCIRIGGGTPALPNCLSSALTDPW